MRKYLLAAAAAAVLSSPGLARDGSPYIGLEGGYIVKADTRFDATRNNVGFDDAFELNYKNGYDLDAILGYDFGAIRAEAEIGHKRLNISDIEGTTAFNTAVGRALTPNADGDKVKVTSGMLNLLVDIGQPTGLGFYAGGGAGLARVKALGDRDSGFAWQLIAGARAPVSENVDVGLKYRYFNASSIDLDRTVNGVGIRSDGKLTSHSILASVIFNFGARAPVVYAPAPAPIVAPLPAPMPAPVATQTCYDGSVIPVTSPCPLPPQPQAPRRGERG